jgi:scyllo-inosamine-4-phosphate amidinotransferase 1
MKVFTKNEYSELKSVIVGRPDKANWPTGDIYFDRLIQLSTYEPKLKSGPVPDQVIKEASDDAYAFIDLLEDHGVKVYRPEIVDWRRTVAGLNHVTNGMHSWSARDLLLTVGDMVIECPTPCISRQHEHLAFQEIKNQAIADGCRWIAAPVARMQPAECVIKDGKIKLTERYPIFDAANVLKFNDKLLYLVSSTGNYAGAKWLQNIVGNEFEVIVWDNVYRFAHIDSTISVINNNTVMLNADRVTGEILPNFLKSYNKIWVHDCKPSGFYKFPYASKWIGMNTLMVNPETIFVDKIQTNLHKQLRGIGLNVVELELRHSRTLGGGFHCITCDLERSL